MNTAESQSNSPEDAGANIDEEKEAHPIVVSYNDFAAVKWEDNWPTVRNLHALSRHFYDQASVARGENDQQAERVYLAVAHSMSLHRKLDLSGPPYLPMIVLGEKRSAAMEDLADETYSTFAAVAPTVKDATVRARLADLAWTRMRDFNAGVAATKAYLESAAGKKDSWTEQVDDLERAFQLATSLGAKAGLKSKVETQVVGLLTSSPESDTYRTSKLAKLLLNYGYEDRKALESLVVARAENHFEAAEWELARSYYELAASFADDKASRTNALYRIAEAFESEALSVLAAPQQSRLLASHHLQRAIEAFRRAGGAKKRVERIHAKLLEVQRESLSELGKVSHEVDISVVVESTQSDFSGKDISDALTSFARIGAIPKKSQLREQVEQQVRDFPLSHLFPRQTLNSSGRVIARSGSSTSSEPREREAALRSEMISSALMHLSIMVAGVIRPARSVIVREHDIRVDHMMEIVRYNPFIDADREPLVAEGLWAGFVADLPKTVHLLIPQLEHAIRRLLEKRGVRVSTFDKYSLQEDRNLNRLLYESVLIDALGEDQVFIMQTLLVEKVGADLRNRMAHGLLDYNSFYGPSAVALWWLAFRFFMTPLLIALESADETDLEGTGGKGGEARR